jgi:hypothetical protein
VVLFLHKNALAHQTLATQKKPVLHCLEFLDHPPCSPDLVPSHNHLFLELKKRLNSRNFSSDAEVFAAVEILLDGQFSDFLSHLQKLEQLATKYIEFRGEYAE